MSEDRELSARDRARVASRAQAEAHRALREKYPEDYTRAYQEAKDRLTEEARRRGAV